MKGLYTGILLTLLAGSLSAQTSWDDFDNPGSVTYVYHDGPQFDQNYTNPSTTGVNTSAICASYARNGGVQYDVIIIDPAGNLGVDDIGPYVAGTKKMSVKVYSPAAGLTLQITLENSNVAGPSNYPTGRHSEYTATTTVANQWETLQFNYVNRPDPGVSDTSVNRMVLLFEPGQFSPNTFLFDDLMGPEFINPCAGVVMDPAIVEDHECQRNLNFTFSNGTRQAIANPMMGGINLSDNCGKFRKFPPPTNDGAFGGSLTNPFTTASFNKAMIHLYDPAAPQDFHVIFQDANNQNIIDTIFTTSQSTAWQEYVMDLSSVATTQNISNIVFLLNPSTATEDTIHFDNFSLGFDSLVTGAYENQPDAYVQVFPNPMDQVLEVRGNFPIEQLSLTDLSGQVLWAKQGFSGNSASIDTERLASGVYFLSITGSNGQKLHQKVVKR